MNEGPRVKRIQEYLQELEPLVCRFVDDSPNHAGHYQGANESHLQLEIVSKSFAGMNKVKRHKLIYKLVEPEWDKGLHSLQIDAKTPEEV